MKSRARVIKIKEITTKLFQIPDDLQPFLHLNDNDRNLATCN